MHPGLIQPHVRDNDTQVFDYQAFISIANQASQEVLIAYCRHHLLALSDAALSVVMDCRLRGHHEITEYGADVFLALFRRFQQNPHPILVELLDRLPAGLIAYLISHKAAGYADKKVHFENILGNFIRHHGAGSAIISFYRAIFTKFSSTEILTLLLSTRAGKDKTFGNIAHLVAGRESASQGFIHFCDEVLSRLNPNDLIILLNSKNNWGGNQDGETVFCRILRNQNDDALAHFYRHVISRLNVKQRVLLLFATVEVTTGLFGEEYEMRRVFQQVVSGKKISLDIFSAFCESFLLPLHADDLYHLLSCYDTYAKNFIYQLTHTQDIDVIDYFYENVLSQLAPSTDVKLESEQLSNRLYQLFFINVIDFDKIFNSMSVSSADMSRIATPVFFEHVFFKLTCKQQRSILKKDKAFKLFQATTGAVLYRLIALDILTKQQLNKLALSNSDNKEKVRNYIIGLTDLHERRHVLQQALENEQSSWGVFFRTARFFIESSVEKGALKKIADNFNEVNEVLRQKSQPIASLTIVKTEDVPIVTYQPVLATFQAESQVKEAGIVSSIYPSLDFSDIGSDVERATQPSVLTLDIETFSDQYILRQLSDFAAKVREEEAAKKAGLLIELDEIEVPSYVPTVKIVEDNAADTDADSTWSARMYSPLSPAPKEVEAVGRRQLMKEGSR